MGQFDMFMDLQRAGDWMTATWEYSLDAWQRSILFTDIMRKRGNQYLEHARKGLPPVLVFDYEMVMDGRELERPVNYAIVRILDRRGPTPAPQAGGDAPRTAERRGAEQLVPRQPFDASKRPIVVIDPRAGHGPGIGGAKLDSQIGVALNAGHPVYFVLFYPEPEPGQTMADVQRAEVAFLEEVIRLHPEAEPPAVIGNCQAGWATALIGADRPDVTGPMVFNGSPLSYWGGVEGANPMRYSGGLYGGSWLTALWCDLGGGTFDGAHLVANFEGLNPANTFWTKQYTVYAKVDSEEQRYLNFEKWWGGFFKLNRDEILFIVDSLFIGNELEQGRLRLDEETSINLKNFKDPIVVFASSGDNITPPQQALNWIYKVYRTVDEIRRNGQVIVYIVHPRIGHLGIFVGSSVAKREHSAIIGTVDMIEFLAPGLYEMVIADASPSGSGPREVQFVERTMEDILQLDDGLEDEEAFNSVAAISRLNQKLYHTFVSPWVRMMVTDGAAEAIRQLHPLRTQRSLCSDSNPFLWPSMFLAPWVREYRQPAASDNPWQQVERQVAAAIEATLNHYRDSRDRLQEQLFHLLYNNTWMQTLFPETPASEAADPGPAVEDRQVIEGKLWEQAMKKGGFEAAVIRVILAMTAAGQSIDQRELLVARRIIQVNDRLKGITQAELKRLVREQAGLIAFDAERALQALPALLPKTDDRIEVFEIAGSIATADLAIAEGEQTLLETLSTILGLEQYREAMQPAGRSH